MEMYLKPILTIVQKYSEINSYSKVPCSQKILSDELHMSDDIIPFHEENKHKILTQHFSMISTIRDVEIYDVKLIQVENV